MLIDHRCTPHSLRHHTHMCLYKREAHSDTHNYTYIYIYMSIPPTSFPCPTSHPIILACAMSNHPHPSIHHTYTPQPLTQSHSHMPICMSDGHTPTPAVIYIYMLHSSPSHARHSPLSYIYVVDLESCICQSIIVIRRIHWDMIHTRAYIRGIRIQSHQE